MTYLWPDGDPVTVEADEYGLPQGLAWHGRAHAVQNITNRWRVDEGWWFRRTRREYFTLITRSGMMLTIFQDRLTQNWYVQRLYD